ncbi:MAG: ABC transporter ATP-binding protein [Stagnimonas sp.]|nr:ABC transporter ATP-binding protein [Stagnimonas sp.]
MGSFAIDVHQLSKRYRLSGSAERPETLLKALTTRLARLRAPPEPETEFWALRDLEFRLRPGEVLGIIGHNGAGKSTLLKILSRVTEPTSGYARVRGRMAALLEVGTGFHPELSGRDNVFMNAAILGLSRADTRRRFDEIVAFAGVEQFIDTPIKHYSSGMKVRLGFAVAAHLDPEIFIIDEALAVGDAAFQKKCMDRIEQVGQGGHTILFVSHHLQSVARLCRRALVLKKGRLDFDGGATDAIRHYTATMESSGTHRCWSGLDSAPGDDRVRLEEVSLLADGQPCTAMVDIRARLTVRFRYAVLTDSPPVMTSVHVFVPDGDWVFTAIDTEPGSAERPRAKGVYEVTAELPLELLNEGSYVIGVAAASMAPHREHFFLRNALSIALFDPMEGDTPRLRFAGELRGPVRPRLQWHTRCEPAVVHDVP